MGITINITDDSLRRNMARLARQGPAQIGTVVATIAALGREYARDIVTEQIYATPRRGEYKRTRFLIRSIYGVSESRGQNRYTVTVGAGAHYALYNEFGTYDGYLGDDAADQILGAARRAPPGLITLEYGDPGKGLEPRPFLLPAMVMLERQLPQILREALRRMMRG